MSKLEWCIYSNLCAFILLLAYRAAGNLPTIKSLVGPRLIPNIHILGVALAYANDPDPGVDELKDPVQDIMHLRDLVAQYEFVKFTMLIESEASRNNILRTTVEILKDHCHSGDLFVLYLAGHSSQDQGYKFLAHHDSSNATSRALSYGDMFQHIREARPPGVYVLQIRDTCFAAPNDHETELLLSQGDNELTMVLAACGSEEAGFEAVSKNPHSVFLARLVEAGKMFEQEMLTSPLEVSRLVRSFFHRVLLPIHEGNPVPQSPALAPMEHQSKVTFSTFVHTLTYDIFTTVYWFFCRLDQTSSANTFPRRYFSGINKNAWVAIARRAAQVHVSRQ